MKQTQSNWPSLTPVGTLCRTGPARYGSVLARLQEYLDCHDTDTAKSGATSCDTSALNPLDRSTPAPQVVTEGTEGGDQTTSVGTAPDGATTTASNTTDGASTAAAATSVNGTSGNGTSGGATTSEPKTGGAPDGATTTASNTTDGDGSAAAVRSQAGFGALAAAVMVAAAMH